MKLFSMRAITVLIFLLLFIRLAFAQFTPAWLPPVINLLLSDSQVDETRLDMVLGAYIDPSSKHIFVAAHRGGKEFDAQEMIPGNSIANISNAISKGFDIYESDIEILRNGTEDKSDDVLVVFHDPDFNNLTNSTVENDLLINASLDYAKSLFLTYDNDEISNERISTLEEFLAAAKGEIMLKFDPKFFDRESLNKIYDAVTSAGMIDQVLLRLGGTALERAKNDGYDTRMIMRIYNSTPLLVDIQELVDNYPDVRAISIPSGADSAVLQAANAAGLVVEIHELSGFTDLDREEAIHAGVRQFHSFSPTPLLIYLRLNGHRKF